MANPKFLEALNEWRALARQYEAALVGRHVHAQEGEREEIERLRALLHAAERRLQEFDLNLEPRPDDN